MSKSQSQSQSHSHQYRFVAESTLGRLAKWLRLAGFDTLYDPHPPDAHALDRLAQQGRRTILTRTRRIQDRLGDEKVVLIAGNDPADQVRQLVHEMGWRPEDLKPLSRCARCNHLLRDVTKADVQHRVPEYVLLIHEAFQRCPGCRRIYWQGSHATRWLTWITQWFE